MPNKMSPELLHFLYDLSVDRTERKKFYANPEKYLATSKPALSSGDKDLLILEAREMGRVYRARRRAHAAGGSTAAAKRSAKRKVPYVSAFERQYGKRMPPFIDQQSFMPG